MAGRSREPDQGRAVDRWVARVLALPRPLLLAFDMDGTLAPIVDVPEAARVPRASVGALRSLADRRGMRVALVTGRDAAGLQRMIRLPEAWRAVEHGRVILPPGIARPAQRLTAVQRARLEAYRGWAETTLVPLGAQLERKATSLGVHTRTLAQRDPAAARHVLDLAARRATRHGLHPRRGRAVLEAEIEAGDKGAALLALYRKTRARGVFYAGDDLTDLPAIRQAVALGGIGLFVRSAERPRTPRGASGSLRGAEEVGALIAGLVAKEW
jgi:trehalose 6-phosphate phosphatase